MTPRLRLAGTLCALAMLAACGDANAPSSVFSHATGFSIGLPSDWKTQTDPSPGTLLSATSERMKATLKVSIQARPARLDWNDFKQTTRKVAGAGVIDTFEDAACGGHKAVFMISKSTAADGKADLTLVCNVAAPERLYLIVLTTKDEMRGEYMHVFRAIIESFKTAP
jgi:hypothetical protein